MGNQIFLFLCVDISMLASFSIHSHSCIYLDKIQQSFFFAAQYIFEEQQRTFSLGLLEDVIRTKNSKHKDKSLAS